MIKGKIHTITFALWDTLITENADFSYAVKGRRIDAICECCGLPDSEEFQKKAEKAYEKAASFIEASYLSRSTISNVKRVEIIIKTLGIKLSDRGQRRLVSFLEESHPFEGIRVKNGALDVLSELAKDYQLAILSDTWCTSGAQLQKTLIETGLATFINAYAFSDQTGCSKTKGDAFTAIAQLLNVAPNEIFHVGDIYEVDVYGAAKAGFGGSALISTGRHPLSFPPLNEDIQMQPIIIDCLRELPPVLTRALSV